MTGINGPDRILSWQLRLNRDIAYHEIRIPVAFVSFPLDVAIPDTPWRKSTVKIKVRSDGSDFITILHIVITPASPCSLKIVQVIFDPTVGPCARIWRLRSFSLFNDQRFFFTNFHCLWSFTAFDHSPLCTYLLFACQLQTCCSHVIFTVAINDKHSLSVNCLLNIFQQLALQESP